MLVKLKKRLEKHGEEQGNALITVVGVMGILMLVSAALFSSIMSHTSVTAVNRTGVSAQAASDTGIDRAVAWLNGVEPDGTYLEPRKYQEILDGNLPTSNGAVIEVGNFNVTLTYKYRVLNDLGRLEVKDSFDEDDTPIALIVDSFAEVKSDSSKLKVTGAQRRTVAEISFVYPDASFDKAVFSGGPSPLIITNDMELIESGIEGKGKDAHVYSNGPIECMTQTKINGTVYTQSDVTINNNCKSLNTLWAAGNVTLKDGAYVQGDLYANGTVNLNNNTPGVYGSVIANGSIILPGNEPSNPSYHGSNSDFNKQNYKNYCGDDFENYDIQSNPAHVCKDVVSFKGSVIGEGNGFTKVLGNVYAGHDVILGGNFNSQDYGIFGNVVAVNNFLTKNSANTNGGFVKGTIKVGNTIGSADYNNNITGDVSWPTLLLDSKKQAVGVTGRNLSCQKAGSSFGWSACSVPITSNALKNLNLTPTTHNNMFPESLFVDNDKSEVNIPPRENMPIIVGPTIPEYDENNVEIIDEKEYDIWNTWEKHHFTGADACQRAKEFIVNGGSPGVDTVVTLQDNACGGQLTLNAAELPLRDKNREITINGNIALVYNQGFSLVNGVVFKPTAENLNLFLIVPADAENYWDYKNGEIPPLSCNNNNSGNITANQLVFNKDYPEFALMLYTPCKVSITNNWEDGYGGKGTFSGQIYAGSVELPANSFFKMKQVNVPAKPVKPLPTEDISAIITGRYNTSVNN